MVVNPKATWIDSITTAELKTIWAPEAQATVKQWSQVRAGWPDRELHLFGAGVDSGTYDYFTQAINGKEGASRGDFTSSEDDNVLVQGIASDELALGFMPYAYYAENRTALKLVGVDDGNADNGAGPIQPSVETVKGGTYQPLSRPVFIYVSLKALDRPEVKQFVDFYLTEGGALAEEVGYVPLGDAGLPAGVGAPGRPQDRLGLRARWLAGRPHHRAAAQPREPVDACPSAAASARSRALLFLCALASVGTTAGIIAVLAVETFGFFREVSIVEFLTGTEWTPLFATKHFGVLPLRARHDRGLGHRARRGRADRPA